MIHFKHEKLGLTLYEIILMHSEFVSLKEYNIYYYLTKLKWYSVKKKGYDETQMWIKYTPAHTYFDILIICFPMAIL